MKLFYSDALFSLFNVKGESQTIDLPWLLSSNPFRVEGFFVGHRIFETENVRYFDVIFNAVFKLGIGFYVYLVSFLFLSILVCLGMIRLTNRLKGKRIKFKSVFISTFVDSQPLKLTAIGLVVYAVSLFVNFCQICILNQIQVDKIVVDTSELILNDYDVLNTDKTACLVKQEIQTDVFGQNSLMQQLIDWKSKFTDEQALEAFLFGIPKCWLTKSIPNQLYDSKVYFVGTQIFELSLYYIYSLLGRQFQGWRYSKPLHEAKKVIYYSMRNPGNHQFAKEM